MTWLWSLQLIHHSAPIPWTQKKSTRGGANWQTSLGGALRLWGSQLGEDRYYHFHPRTRQLCCFLSPAAFLEIRLVAEAVHKPTGGIPSRERRS